MSQHVLWYRMEEHTQLSPIVAQREIYRADVGRALNRRNIQGELLSQEMRRARCGAGASRKNAATPLRGARRWIGAGKTHVGIRHGQQHWEATAQDVANSTKQYSPFPRCPERSACSRRSERRCLQRSRLTSRSAPGGVTLSPRCSAALVSMGNDWQHWTKWARRGLTAMEEQLLRKSSWQRG